MAFTVGQVVELEVWSDYGADTVFRTGDRGTVMGPSTFWGACARMVFWHRLGRETSVLVNRLRIYAPRATQRVSSVDVLLALQTVLREEQPHAITELRRERAELRQELEHARLLERRREARHNAFIAETVESNRQLRVTMDRLMLAAQAAVATERALFAHTHTPADGTVERALRDAWLQMMAAHLELSYQIVEIVED